MWPSIFCFTDVALALLLRHVISFLILLTVLYPSLPPPPPLPPPLLLKGRDASSLLRAPKTQLSLIPALPISCCPQRNTQWQNTEFCKVVLDWLCNCLSTTVAKAWCFRCHRRGWDSLCVYFKVRTEVRSEHLSRFLALLLPGNPWLKLKLTVCTWTSQSKSSVYEIKYQVLGQSSGDPETDLAQVWPHSSTHAPPPPPPLPST